MGRYLLRRSILLLPTLFVISVVAFLSIRLMPGAMPGIGSFALTPQERHLLGLGSPIHVAYWEWLLGLFTNSLGQSLWTSRLLTTELARRLPVTLELTLLSTLVAQLIAVPSGVFTALRRSRMAASFGKTAGMLLGSLPVMWLGVLALVLPRAWWGWTPPQKYTLFSVDPLAHLWQVLIPAVAIGIVVAGPMIGALHAAAADISSRDYMRTARAKGLRPGTVLVRHGLRNGIAPWLTASVRQLPWVVAGVIIMEHIFGLPGVGRLFLDAVNQRDFPFISGLLLVSGVTGMLAYFAADVLRAWLDPRVRYVSVDPVGWGFEV